MDEWMGNGMEGQIDRSEKGLMDVHREGGVNG